MDVLKNKEAQTMLNENIKNLRKSKGLSQEELAVMNSSYLNWNYNDPELAVAGTILHGFEFIFARLAPIAFWFMLLCL